MTDSTFDDDEKNNLLKPSEVFTSTIGKDELKMIEDAKNMHLKPELYMDIQEKKESIVYFLVFIHEVFGCTIDKIILTNKSNFKSDNEVYLLRCHKFLQSINLDSINWEKSVFTFDAYGQMNLKLFIGDFDYVHFMNIGLRTCILRFSFDLISNHFTLEYPYPIKEKLIPTPSLNRHCSYEKEEADRKEKEQIDKAFNELIL